MPNHFHAIIHLGTDPARATIPPLGDVIRWFRIRTTYDYTIGEKTEGWPRFPGRLWQQKYYERIVCDEGSLERARIYVEGNSGKWADDEYYQRSSPSVEPPGYQNPGLRMQGVVVHVDVSNAVNSSGRLARCPHAARLSVSSHPDIKNRVYGYVW